MLGKRARMLRYAHIEYFVLSLNIILLLIRIV